MKIEGWASTPKLDHARDIVMLGAFDESIRTKGLSGPKGIKLLAQHNSDQPIGVIHKLEQRPAGLWMEAEIDDRISYAADLIAAIETNGGLSYSIGYRLIPGFVEYDEENDLFRIAKLNLHEVSVVTFPCNDDCVMSFPKSLNERMADIKSRLDRLNGKPPTVADTVSKMADLTARLRKINKGT